MPDREQMTPEALALQMETWEGWTRPRRDAAAAYLRRLAALEREAEVWAATSSRAEEKIAALERENARWRAWWFEEGYRGSAPPEGLLRETLAGATDTREQRSLEYEPMNVEDWKEKADALERECARLRRVLASLVESPWRASAARRIIRETLAGAPDAPGAQEGV